MLQTDSLHRRLDAPNLRVEMTKANLMRRQKWNDGHKLTVTCHSL
ncbi:MAG: hypothetical protein WBB25_10525 [Sulfitobacter sp.]